MHSLGGMIALEVACQWPERVKSLSLLVTTSGIFSMLRNPQQASILQRLLDCFDNSNEAVATRLLHLLYPEAYLDAPYESDISRTNRQVLHEYHLERVSQAQPPSRPGLIGQFCAVLTHHVSHDRLREIQAKHFPILVVSAEEDRLIHPSNSHRLYESLAGEYTRHANYKDAGHGVMLQNRTDILHQLQCTFNAAQQPTTKL